MGRSIWGNAAEWVGGVGAIWYGLAEGTVRTVVRGENFQDAFQKGANRLNDRVLDAADYLDRNEKKINKAAKKAAKKAAARAAGKAVGEAAARTLDRS